jgi:hypothetical protein
MSEARLAKRTKWGKAMGGVAVAVLAIAWAGPSPHSGHDHEGDSA